MTAYEVIAECAHVTVMEPGDISVTKLLYKGAPVPDGVEPKRLKHLIDSHLVAEVGKVPLAPNASVSQDPAAGLDSVTRDLLTGKPAAERTVPSDVAAAVAETAVNEGSVDKATIAPGAEGEFAERRAAAKAKLPSDGSAPDGRASKDVLVEYLATKGYLFEELVKQEPAELKALVKQQS
jgi:hypothetical protein